MDAIQIVLGIAMGIISIAVIILVLFQQGSRSGINGAISGAAETFLSKNRARTADGFFKRVTTILAIIFFILALAATIFATFAEKSGL